MSRIRKMRRERERAPQRSATQARAHARRRERGLRNYPGHVCVPREAYRGFPHAMAYCSICGIALKAFPQTHAMSAEMSH